ncbi:MAG: DUF2087 domain-containing protein [Anaerolineales bacterium]|nr:DUF2087 domain-containing protein [Anaerolineales bacterium]
MSKKISSKEFKSRLATMCAQGGGRGLPRNLRDQQILFKSITLTLDPDKSYTETELNLALGQWQTEVGQMIEIDHVSLRRYLVDAGFVQRDSAGLTYHVSTVDSLDIFEPDVETLDPAAVIIEAQLDRERRKQDYLKKQNTD